MLCVGIDPETSRIPKHIRHLSDAFFQFGKAIVDATAEHVCAFKPQAAHFAAQGCEDQLSDLITYIRETYPEIIVILDAKRGDVGSTAKLYAREAFERYSADAVTVNPYLGYESLKPYFDYSEKGVVVLCRTSNPGSDWLQKSLREGKPLYLEVAEQVASWDDNGQCMLVTGATYPEELALVRAAVGDMPLLVPGVGAQGGSVQEVLAAGKDSGGFGLVISSSRGIIYAGEGEDFAAQAGIQAKKLKQEINHGSS
jgi:orotidine-5'-phosphate decarboxylase